jgi:hypothetical protein
MLMVVILIIANILAMTRVICVNSNSNMSRSQYRIGNFVMGVLRDECVYIRLLLHIFRYGIDCETSLNIQIHQSRKTDAEIDEYIHS